jgi:hypothetical protein
MTIPEQEESQVVSDLLALADSASDDLTAARFRDMAINCLMATKHADAFRPQHRGKHVPRSGRSLYP